MAAQYDAIIIGAGHNGLAAAAVLAGAGRRVLVLERRAVSGGAAATESVFPGCRINTGAVHAGLFAPEIIRELQLEKYELTFLEPPAAVTGLLPRGKHLTLWRDVQKTVAELGAGNTHDAAALPEFTAFMDRMADILRAVRLQTPPALAGAGFAELWPWLRSAMKLRRLGRRDMMTFLRVLPMAAGEFLDEWFSDPALKGIIGGAAVGGGMQGPRAAGTVYNLLYHYCGNSNGGYKSVRFVKGGTGGLSDALRQAAEHRGAEVRLAAPVENIILTGGAAGGVRLTSGEELSGRTILSNADPRYTFLTLVGASQLGPEFVRRVRNIRFRGTTARFNLLLGELPDIPGIDGESERLSGHVVICPNPDYLERAADAAKYGRFSEAPFLEMVIPTIPDPALAPAGKHLLTVTMQYAPYHLREGDWAEARESLRQTILSALTAHMPDLPAVMEADHLITPADYQADYGLSEGSIYHGQMALDQLAVMRPVPGWGHYRTPVKGLYLCGAGTHPGGGLTGAPGYNAAREVLRDDG